MAVSDMEKITEEFQRTGRLPDPALHTAAVDDDEAVAAGGSSEWQKQRWKHAARDIADSAARAEAAAKGEGVDIADGVRRAVEDEAIRAWEKNVAGAEPERMLPALPAEGYKLDLPPGSEDVREVTVEGVAEWGRIAKASGFTPEVATVFAELTVHALQKDPPGRNGWNADHTEHVLKEQLGHDEYPAVVNDVRKFVADRPHLWRALDDGLGNNPGVLMALAAVAREPALLTKAGAQRFLDKLTENKAYWTGSKLEVMKARVAHAIVR
jgi:hypothetical protein